MSANEIPNNYTLGRGEIYFARFLPNTRTPGGERYLGNTPEFNATIESENLDHYNSDRGIKEKDDSIPLQTNRAANFITDNINPENISLFFFGEKTDFTVAGAAVTGETVAAVIPGLFYQLGMSATNPVGARSLAETPAPVVMDDAATPTTFVAGTDYDIDLVLGRIYVKPGGAITGGTNLVIDYTTETSTQERVISGNRPIEGAMRYIAYNPAGKQYDWYMPYVKLMPNGDYALKGDEWQQIPFMVEILRKSGLEAIYVQGRPLVAG